MFEIILHITKGQNLKITLPTIRFLDTNPTSELRLSTLLALLSPRTKYLSLGIVILCLDPSISDTLKFSVKLSPESFVFIICKIGFFNIFLIYI